MNARVESPFDVHLQDALSLARDWIPRWISRLPSVLQQREVAAAHLHEKQAYAQARLVLNGCRDRLAERFLSALCEATADAMAQVSRSAPPSVAAVRKSSTLSLDDLQLMDNDQVQASVEMARLQQVIKTAAEEELMGLCALFSGAQGLSTVRLEANPLRPEVVVGALTHALKRLNVDEASRMRWLHAGAASLGSELHRFYRDLSERLQRQGVRPAVYAVIPTAVAPRADAQPEKISDAEVLTLDHLHRLLVGNLDNGGSLVSDHGASGSGNAMVRTLAAEVVTLMLRGIADDTRLLPPVRDMVQQLKPALLYLARSEPRFFADRLNPARRLLDTITERSLAFTSEQDNGYAAYAGQVHHAVRSLQSPTSGLAARIEEQLGRLASLEAASLPPGQCLAIQALARVEERHLLAERVAAEIQARHDLVRAPGLVRRFLGGPWSQAVAQARLGAAADPAVDGAADQAQRYMDILPDLLWSCQLSQASLNRPRLVRVVPVMLRTLREGLDAIDYPRSQAESFFHALLGLHEAAYKTQRLSDNGVSPLARPAEPPPSHWMYRDEARQSGFVDAERMEPDFVDTQPLPRDEAVDTPELVVGAWIDLSQDDQVRRCQLRWASPHGTLFLFAATDGRSVSLTRRGLDRLSATGRVRVIASQGVVDEALAAVARQAWINSGKL